MIDVHIIRDKLAQFERKIAEELGSFALFALVQRDNSNGSWDVLVSASWFDEPMPDTLTPAQRKVWALRSPNRSLFYSRFVKAFTIDELIAVTGPLDLALSEPFVRAFIERVAYETGGTLEHTLFEFANWSVDRVDLLRGYVITANGADLPAQKPPIVRRRKAKELAV